MRRLVLFIFLIFAMQIVVGESNFAPPNSGGFSSTSYQSRASFDRYYSSSDINTYWPILGNRETCDSRQDVLLQIPPGGCQPSVVRSDLLAEQNVPVFCQVSALKVNPLIDIENIRNIRFRGNYPKEVVGTGFHPAQAAIRTHDQLLGNPLMDNIGYVVVVLRKNEKESEIPNLVNFTLSAQIEYEIENSVGIGRTEFILKEVSDEEWEIEKYKQSFWQGRYYLRLESADENFAIVAVYQGDKKVATLRTENGKPSNDVYVPGMYCRAGLYAEYLGLEKAEDKARIEVSSDVGTEIYDLYKGSKFLYNKCTVNDIDINNANENFGDVSISCGRERILLKIRAVDTSTGIELSDE